MTDGSQIELFKHIDVAHQDLAKGSARILGPNKMGWLSRVTDLEAGDDTSFITDEKLDTLTKLSKTQIILLATEETVAESINDYASKAFCEKIKRLQISEKGTGRKDSKELVASIKQSVSIPTTLQKVRKVLTGKAGKEETEEYHTDEV